MGRSQPEPMHRASPTSNIKTVSPPHHSLFSTCYPLTDTLTCINADSLRCLTVWGNWCKCLYLHILCYSVLRHPHILYHVNDHFWIHQVHNSPSNIFDLPTKVFNLCIWRSFILLFCWMNQSVTELNKNAHSDGNVIKVWVNMSRLTLPQWRYVNFRGTTTKMTDALEAWMANCHCTATEPFHSNLGKHDYPSVLWFGRSEPVQG